MPPHPEAILLAVLKISFLVFLADWMPRCHQGGCSRAVTQLLNGRNGSGEKLRRKGFSCSTFMIYLGLDTLYRDEPHHQILFADDYHRNVNEIQKERTVSQDMSDYVRNSSVTDLLVAPEGHSNRYLLVPTINTRHRIDWPGMQSAYRDKVLDRVEARAGMKDLRRHIVEERMITPRDWRDDGPIFLRVTFNLKHALNQLLYLRPHNRYAKFRNLYLTGGGTHPGSGLPTIYESARISSNLICEQFGSGLRLFCFILRGSGYPNPLTPRGPVLLAAANNKLLHFIGLITIALYHQYRTCMRHFDHRLKIKSVISGD